MQIVHRNQGCVLPTTARHQPERSSGGPITSSSAEQVINLGTSIAPCKGWMASSSRGMLQEQGSRHNCLSLRLAETCNVLGTSSAVASPCVERAAATKGMNALTAFA